MRCRETGGTSVIEAMVPHEAHRSAMRPSPATWLGWMMCLAPQAGQQILAPLFSIGGKGVSKLFVPLLKIPKFLRGILAG